MLRKKYNDIKKTINNRRRKHEYDRAEFEQIMNELIPNPAVREMLQYNHHSHTSCFRHSMHVSYFNFKICKKLGLDAKAGAKAGLLHDLFLYDWHNKPITFDDSLHGFSHPYVALRNANKHFKLTDKEKDIIEKHMFPLTPRFPKYKETVVITLTDKFCSVCEVMDRFFKKAA